jgi:3-oxoadipate enol-lactonase
MAADALAVIDALDLERVFLVGHSLGGFIAQTFTLAYPERVAKLVLCGTSFGGPNSIPPTPEALAVLMLDRTLDPMELIRRGLATAVAPSFLTERPEDLQALIEHRLTIPVPPEANAEETVSKIAQPTLILSGELDMVVPPGNAALLKERIPHAVCQTIPDAGHLFPIEKPSLTANLIDEFFSL